MTEEINKKEPVFIRMDRKFIRDLAKFGNVAQAGEIRSYFLTQVFVKTESMPIGVYQVVELKDLPDDVLESFGLQKIPATSSELDWDKPQWVRHKITKTVYQTDGRHFGEYVTIKTVTNGDLEFRKSDLEFYNDVID